MRRIVATLAAELQAFPEHPCGWQWLVTGPRARPTPHGEGILAAIGPASVPPCSVMRQTALASPRQLGVVSPRIDAAVRQ